LFIAIAIIYFVNSHYFILIDIDHTFTIKKIKIHKKNDFAEKSKILAGYKSEN